MESEQRTPAVGLLEAQLRPVVSQCCTQSPNHPHLIPPGAPHFEQSRHAFEPLHLRQIHLRPGLAVEMQSDAASPITADRPDVVAAQTPDAVQDISPFTGINRGEFAGGWLKAENEPVGAAHDDLIRADFVNPPQVAARARQKTGPLRAVEAQDVGSSAVDCVTADCIHIAVGHSLHRQQS